jgi:hypothetical protein
VFVPQWLSTHPDQWKSAQGVPRPCLAATAATSTLTDEHNRGQLRVPSCLYSPHMDCHDALKPQGGLVNPQQWDPYRRLLGRPIIKDITRPTKRGTQK